jgi:beta-aspartyl-dipeptidase (metallo-type)
MPGRPKEFNGERSAPMFKLIENGEIYDPEHIGKCSVLMVGDKIARIDHVDGAALARAGLEVETIDATGCIVVPGLIDPHQHLLGGSGEEGFASQTPEISAREIVQAGITTVVGCLGVDSSMKTMAGLLAKVKGLKEEGLNAYAWSGGYAVPPTTITHSVSNDIMFLEEVIGAGEIAISDNRGLEPSPQELARLISDAHNGGMLSRKAGLTHFHVGDGDQRLAILRDVIENYKIEAGWIYPTHIHRSEELLLEAIELAKNGSFIDIDTVDEDLPKWLRFYLDNNGWPEKLTVSSDASITSPMNLFNQLRECVLKHRLPITQVLSLATVNPACALSLTSIKGRVAEGLAADVLVLSEDDWELREVFSRGRRLIKEGRLGFEEAFLKESNRDIHLRGSGGVRDHAKREPDSAGVAEVVAKAEPANIDNLIPRERFLECNTPVERRMRSTSRSEIPISTASRDGAVSGRRRAGRSLRRHAPSLRAMP